MRVIKTAAEVRRTVDLWNADKLLIGLVPTMGALHEGHLSLVRRARKQCEALVVSIFVNPTQFGPKEDFKKYPRDLEKDIALLRKEKADMVFTPSLNQMYPSSSKLILDTPSFSKIMCGESRSSHFQGVLLVVAKLFNIVNPHIAYFGQKDFQQAFIIEQMVNDLNFPVRIIKCPIVREKDGLAMSSRNAYLSQKERKNAICLWRAFKTAKGFIKERNEKNIRIVLRAMRDVVLSYSDVKIDYLTIRDARSLEEIKHITPGKKIVIAGAVCVGKTRLIDNVVLRV